jgi:hypothetical protein
MLSLRLLPIFEHYGAPATDGSTAFCALTTYVTLRACLHDPHGPNSGCITCLLLRLLRPLHADPPPPCPLLSWPHYLPPDDRTDERLLAAEGSTFLRTPLNHDRRLLSHLGVQQISRVAFWREHVLGRLASLPCAVRTSAVASLLRDARALGDEEREPFLAHLRQAAFVPNGRSSDGSPALCLPGSLYDPSGTQLAALLEEEAFPHRELHGRDSIEVLRTLGLRATLSLTGVCVCVCVCVYLLSPVPVRR